MNPFFKELTSSVKKELITSDYQTVALIDPAQYTTPDGNFWTFDNLGGSYNYFRFDGLTSCVEAYNRCPIISSIIGQQAQAFVNGKVKYYDNDGKELKNTNATVKKMIDLLRKPNPLQSWKTFEAQLYTYVKLFEFAIILPVKPFGFKNKMDASSLWNIPPNWLDWSATEERFNQLGGTGLTEIVISYNGQRTILKLEDVIIVRGFNPQLLNQGTSLTFPASRVYQNEMFINNIIGALESRNMLINYRGALGILSQDTGAGQYVPVAMLPQDKEDLQKDFQRYGLRKNQFQVILTSAALKWQQMGYPTKELMLMEEVEQSSIGLCAAWNFPPFILGFKDATFHNMNEAEKHLYTNCIWPDSDNIYEQITDGFGLSMIGVNMRKDYSHVAPLQEDKLEAAAAKLALNRALELQWKNGNITLNQWLQKLGDEPIQGADGRGDLYYPEYIAKYGLAPVAPNNAIDQANQEGKMLARIQSRDATGRFTELWQYIFDNTTPNGQEI